MIIDPSFQRVKRLFVLLLEGNVVGTRYKGNFLLKVEIKN